ncbi:MAG: glycine cleavage system aminomethyltransferase GcvT [Phycisphaerae bacterium]
MHKTALNELHRQYGAKLVDFAGWEMPVMYTSITEEHNWCRQHVAAFDVSHMGRLRFRGGDAEKFLQRMCTRNLSEMPTGLCRYGHVCREDAGILDDVIVSKFDDHFGMVCNASNREKLLGWFATHLQGADVQIEDETFETAMLAVQGPEALKLLDAVLPIDLSDLKRYRFKSGDFQGAQFAVYRSGYTGEDGAEVVMPAGFAAIAAALFMQKSAELGTPVKLAGLGARDSLRLEAGMPLYGHELTEAWDSLTAGQEWCVDLSKEFIGCSRLREIDNAGPERSMCGFVLEGRRAARQGAKIIEDGREVGEITSGALTPTIGKPIAMGLLDTALASPGSKVPIDLRGTLVEAEVVPLPFYKRRG